MAETLKANPYVYADNDPVNAVDPSRAYTITPQCQGDLAAFIFGFAISVAALASPVATAVAAIIAAGPIGWIVGIIGGAVLAGFAYQGIATVWNGTVADACGFAKLPLIPISITIN